MKINEFKLERYFAIHEFTAKYLLSPSDCESLTMKDLVNKADDESLKLWDNLKLGYTESQGHPRLREEIAKLYENLKKENIITIVPEEGIFVAMNTILDAGDHVIVLEPIYQSLIEVAKSIGCSITNWTIQENNHQWQLDIGLLEKIINEKTKMIIMNFPHNPTGYIPTKEDFNKIIEIAKKHNLYIFSDEMYRLLEHDHDHRLPSVADIYEKGVSLFGLSKTFSLPGLRLGWLVTQNEALLQRFATFKDYITICGSAPSEILGLMALRQKEAIIQCNIERIKENLAEAKGFCSRHRNLFTWMEPKGGSTAFIKLSSKFQVEEFCDRMVKDKGIMIVPSSIFDYEGNYFRVGLGRKDFKLILREMEEYIVELNGNL